jgi:hypothetical protein
LERYRRHAELFGTEEVYETAATDGFVAAGLGRFALALRRIDPKWRLSRGQRADLLARLQEEGEQSDHMVREYLGVSQDTLRRMRKPARRAEAGPQTGGSGTGVQVPGFAALEEVPHA